MGKSKTQTLRLCNQRTKRYELANVEKECAQVEKNKSIKHENKIVRSFRKSKVGVILLNEETLRSGKGDVDLTSWAMVG